MTGTQSSPRFRTSRRRTCAWGRSEVVASVWAYRLRGEHDGARVLSQDGPAAGTRGIHVRADDDRFRTLQLSGAIFLVDDDTGASYPLDGCGERLWQLICNGATVEEAASTLAVEQAGDPVVVLDDVRRLVSDLIDVGAIDQRN